MQSQIYEVNFWIYVYNSINLRNNKIGKDMFVQWNDLAVFSQEIPSIFVAAKVVQYSCMKFSS